MSQSYRILIIDDHPLMRRGIRQLLELEPDFQVIGEASNGQEGIRLAQQQEPDVIILDLNMKGLTGLETLQQLRQKGVTAHIGILTVSDAKADIFALVDAGADGYLLKDSEPDLLLQQIKQLAHGEIVYSPEIQYQLQQRKISPEPLLSLTERESAVLERVAKGMSNKQIAEMLFISEETVKVHIRNMLRKLNVNSRVAATVLYLQYKGV
ncbi:response regulator [Testudinibacter aquarius]|uniref:LuxR family two component transcriptional regulator n=1 Tax=Testudinibacter aquarius TaxID=1524974 RepID=A0A4R3XWR7_9PAST|nr:response regulator [Testudinibacter aquarius]TNG91291.1 response regulator [Pasteurellaceae bacterium USgator41]TNG96516.1 response regulator [Pasteurellaceae bacterium UScroc31]TNG97100.1 response regulator [Pasteurellaceae bacterium UScroc12]TNH01547.1 response regulator [Pasteurellaceae bacterium USgator11]KAE9526430.1 DNA-binding response regulator [Testudinibacter aquarius]